MPTQHFLVKMKSQVAKPILDALVTELENSFEEFLRREVMFVSQCYRAGSNVWWRKLFHVGIKMPSDSEIRNWLTSHTSPSFWTCFNPNVMVLAHEHFDKRTFKIKLDLAYARQLVLECTQKDEIDVWVQLIERHPALKSVTKSE